MNSINSEIFGLVKSITEKLEQPSDSEIEFEIKSPTKNKPKVEHVFKIPSLPLSTAPHTNSCIATVDTRLERMNSENDEASQSDKAEKSSDKSLPSQFSTMKPTEINSTNFMSLEDISEDEELWLIMAPKDCKLKKQNVEMEGRHDLKGGKFEIEFFRSDSENNMVALVCENEQLGPGPHFKGCVQISEKLQSFSPKYHDIVKKENQIPSGLKQRYVPFGADIDGVRYKKDKDGSLSSTGLKNNISSLSFDLDAKPNVIESLDTDGRPKDKKERSNLKRKHTEIPASDVNILTDSPDTEIIVNSEISKRKKKKKRKSYHNDE